MIIFVCINMNCEIELIEKYLRKEFPYVVKIKEFGDAIYNGVIARIKQGIEALGLFGKAIGKLFKGDFTV